MRWAMRRRARVARKTVTVDGRRWPYLEGGDRSKPALAMVHGFRADKDHWTFYAPWLTKEYRLTQPDLPGSGRNCRDGDMLFNVSSSEIAVTMDRERMFKTA